jgi:hypothetical protein
MDKTEKILILNNEIEASLLSSILQEKSIPHIIRSYHDSVYDGLFQVQSGWGHLEAPPAFRDEIMRVYSEINK